MLYSVAFSLIESKPSLVQKGHFLSNSVLDEKTTFILILTLLEWQSISQRVNKKVKPLYLFHSLKRQENKPSMFQKGPIFSLTLCLIKRRHLYSSLHCWRGRRRAPWWPGRPGASPHSPPSRQDSAPARLIKKTHTKVWLTVKIVRRKLVISESYQNCISVTSADGSFGKGTCFFVYMTLGVKITLCVHNSLRTEHSHPANKYDIFMHFPSTLGTKSVLPSLCKIFKPSSLRIFLGSI